MSQTLAAIDMLRAGRYECAVTLAGAAEAMLPTSPRALHAILMTLSVPDELSQTSYAELDPKGRNAFWNAERDWLKHSGPDHPDQWQIHRRDAESMIVRALTKVLSAITAIPPSALPALRWFYRSYVEVLGWQPPDGRPIDEAIDLLLGLRPDRA